MKNYFTLLNGGFKTLFGFVPALTGPQGTAVSSVSSNFVSIGTIMAEGEVNPELGAIAIQALYDAQLAVNNAIAHGWKAGKGQY